MFELFLFGGLAWLGIRLFDVFDKWSYESRRREAELRALNPPPPSTPKPAKPKPRRQQVKDTEALLAEELKFCKRLTDPVARQAAEASAYVRFRQRLLAIMESTPQ